MDLAKLNGNVEITNDTPLGKYLGRMFRKMNRRSVFANLLYGGREILPKADFVKIMQQLVDNRALCPEGSTYSRNKIRKIIRDFLRIQSIGFPNQSIKQRIGSKFQLSNILKTIGSMEFILENAGWQASKKYPH